MRIAVNTQHLLKDRLEGIGWFAHETLRRLVNDHPEHEFIFIFDRKWDKSFIYGPNVTPVSTMIPSRHPFLWFWHYEIDIPRILRKYKPDLFFSPDGWMSLSTKVPTVDVIHDINFMQRAEDFPYFYRKFYRYFFPRYAQKARQIITVSEYSKADIVNTLSVDPSKIDVAYNGCGKIFQPLSNEVKVEVRKRFTNGDPYFVFVGSQNPRKNIVGMLDAFELFKKRTRNKYKLLLVGKPMWGSVDFDQKIESLKCKDDIVFTNRVSTEVLQLLLGSSEALMLVSFLEGFGIPIIEAMNCDVPVICSNVTSLPEVAGDAALLVDPYNVESIADAMVKIAKDEKLRRDLIQKGRLQREKFSWDRTADAVWNSIQKIVQ